MMYFESDLRKNMVDLEEIISTVKRNEMLLKRREIKQISADAAQLGIKRARIKSDRRHNGSSSQSFSFKLVKQNGLTLQKGRTIA